MRLSRANTRKLKNWLKHNQHFLVIQEVIMVYTMVEFLLSQLKLLNLDEARVQQAYVELLTPKTSIIPTEYKTWMSSQKK